MRGVEQIALEHRIVPGENRDVHGGILRTLALVDDGGIRGNQCVEFAEAVRHRAPIKAGNQFAGVEIDIFAIADLAGGVWSLVNSPDAVIHSPAEIMAACPTTVTRSRRPRAFALRTQKPFSEL